MPKLGLTQHLQRLHDGNVAGIFVLGHFSLPNMVNGRHRVALKSKHKWQSVHTYKWLKCIAATYKDCVLDKMTLPRWVKRDQATWAVDVGRNSGEKQVMTPSHAKEVSIVLKSGANGCQRGVAKSMHAYSKLHVLVDMNTIIQHARRMLLLSNGRGLEASQYDQVVPTTR